MTETWTLPMTADEICEMYRTAKSKAKQVGILAELNCTSRERIVEILEEYGYAVDGRAKRYLKKEERIAAAPSEPRNDKAGETEYPSTADAVPLPLGKGGSGEAASTHTHTHTHTRRRRRRDRSRWAVCCWLSRRSPRRAWC